MFFLIKLLRTIDNLHQVSDNIISDQCQDDDLLKGEETHGLALNGLIEDEPPIWRNPPWTNKPIRDLTERNNHHDAGNRILKDNVHENVLLILLAL